MKHVRTFLAVMVGITLGFAARNSLASRNSSGTMSAFNGPYVSGTTISSTAINARFSDIENELTDSLSRSGKGGMTAPLKEADGTVAAPSFSFTNEPGSGLYRIGPSDIGVSVNGTKRSEWTSAGLSVVGAISSTTLGVTGDTTLTGKLGVGSASAPSFNLDVAGAVNGTDARIGGSTFPLYLLNNWPGLGFNIFYNGTNWTYGSTNPGFSIQYDPTGNLIFQQAASGTAGATVTPTEVARITSAGVLQAGGGLKIGSSGTAISASLRGSTSFSGASFPANGSVGASPTVTGAVAGADCFVTPGAASPIWPATCSVDASNVCHIVIFNNTTSSTTLTGTYYCRVFNP